MPGIIADVHEQEAPRAKLLKLLLSSLSGAAFWAVNEQQMKQGRVTAAYLKRGPRLRLFVLLSSFPTLLAKEFRPLSSETKPALFPLVL